MLALQPIIGIQIPAALLLCLLFRCNFMVAGALQLVTNPLTAAPVYYVTWRLGRLIERLAEWIAGAATLPAVTLADEPLMEDPAFSSNGQGAWESVILPLVIGGVVAGLILAVLLDLGYFFWRRAASAPRRLGGDRSPSTPSTHV